MRLSLFPDINVWLALTHNRHVHHAAAAGWFELAGDSCSFFICRFTQLGLLRLLTTAQVMGADVITQRHAWTIYQRWFEDGRIEFHREPENAGFEFALREAGIRPQPAPKAWADAYLAAFARTAGLSVVTFDRGFPRLAGLDVKVLAA